MATPKKKVSRSRRNMRRFSYKYALDPITLTKDAESGDTVRTHRVTVETAAAYVAARNKAKAKRATSASKSK